MVTGTVRVLRGGVVHPSEQYKRMGEQAHKHWVDTIRETGADPLWWKLMRNPKFRAAVEAEGNRIYLEAIDDIAKRRAAELGILQGLEEEYQRRLRAPGRQLAALLPANLNELLKKLAVERETGSTYGALAEYNQFTSEFEAARERGDRLVLLGKWSGRQLKKLLEAIHPEIDLSALQDTVNYGGDLMIIGLERREFESWVRHLSLWGMNNDDAGLLTRTVQMKWGETTDPDTTEHQITYAGIQLAGQRDESALPFGHKEISIGVLNPLHPWAALDNTDAASILVPAIQRAFAQGRHGTGSGQLNVPRGGLYPFVTRIIIRTTNWTFRFVVSGNSITLTSSVREPGQHRALLSELRPGKGLAGAQDGTLVCVKGSYFIQGKLRKYTLSALEAVTLGLAAILKGGKSANVSFTVDQSNKVSAVVSRNIG